MNKFSAFLFLPAVAATLLSSCGVDCLEGNGRLTTESRELPSFSSISMEGSYKLVLTRDSNQTVSIAADENLMGHVKTEVNNGRLRVYSDESLCDDVEIAINMPELNGLLVSGAVEVETTNRFVSPEFALEVAGAAEADMDFEADIIRTEISGAGEVTYRGKAGEHRVEISGACELDAFELQADKYDIQINGAGSCRVHVLSELNVRASGAGEVIYRGNPENIQQEISGAGNVRAAE